MHIFANLLQSWNFVWWIAVFLWLGLWVLGLWQWGHGWKKWLRTHCCSTYNSGYFTLCACSVLDSWAC